MLNVCSFPSVACSTGLARISAVFARSSRVLSSIVLSVSGCFGLFLLLIPCMEL